MLSARDMPQNKGFTQRMKRWKKYSKQMDIKKTVVAILISNKIDFKTKAIERDKEGHYITLRE